MRTWIASGLTLALAWAVSPTALAGEEGSAMKHHGMSRGAAAEKHEGMMEEMQARQQKLDELVASMEAAEGPEKVDAVAAVVKELVAQRRARVERMQDMHERMMEEMHEGMEPPESQGSGTEHEPGH